MFTHEKFVSDVRAGNTDAVVAALEFAKTDTSLTIDPTDPNDLIIVDACREGHSVIVRELLAWRGPGDVRVNPTIWNHSSLILSCQHGHVEVVKILLMWYETDEKRPLPLDLNLYNCSFMMACRFYHTKVVDAFLNWNVPAPPRVSIEMNGNGALRLACDMCNPEIVDLLLKWEGPGGTFFDPRVHRNDCLNTAAEHGREHVVRRLLQWSGPGKETLDPTLDEDRVLRTAVAQSRVMVVKVLLEWDSTRAVFNLSAALREARRNTGDSALEVVTMIQAGIEERLRWSPLKTAWVGTVAKGVEVLAARLSQPGGASGK